MTKCLLVTIKYATKKTFNKKEKKSENFKTCNHNDNNSEYIWSQNWCLQTTNFTNGPTKNYLQLFNFCRTIVLRVNFDSDNVGSLFFSDFVFRLSLPLDLLSDVTERGFDEVADAVHLAGRDHEVFRLKWEIDVDWWNYEWK